MYNERILGVKDHATRAWLKYIWRDVNKNKFGFFGAITGLPGSGKTDTSMLLMFFQDPTFTPDNVKERITRNPKDFLRTLNSLEKHQWVSMTDAGLSTSISSKNWNKIGNILIEDTTQIQRIKQCGVILDVQVVKFIDNRVRALFQWFTEVKRYENNPVTWKIHRVQVNQIQDNILYPHPIIMMNERLFKLRTIKLVGMVPKAYRDEWEEIQFEFKDGLMKRHVKAIEKIETEENPPTTWERIEFVEKNREEYTNDKGKLDADLIMLKLEIGRSEAAKIVKGIRKGKNVKSLSQVS